MVTFSYIDDNGVHQHQQKLNYAYVGDETDDHYLLLLQRDSDCVVGVGHSLGRDNRHFAFYRLTEQGVPNREGGSWD